MVKIFIFSGYGHNQSFDLVGNSVYIGRSEDNDIQISDMSVSRRHLEIIEKDGQYYIKDLNSQNGTYVNGKQIEPDKYIEIDNVLKKHWEKVSSAIESGNKFKIPKILYFWDFWNKIFLVLKKSIRGIQY